MRKSEIERIIKEEIDKLLEQTGNPYGDDLMYQYKQKLKGDALEKRTVQGRTSQGKATNIPFSSLARPEQIAYDLIEDPKPSMMFDDPVIGGNVKPELRHGRTTFATYKKPIPLNFKVAQADITVNTKEGPVKARKGDFIMTGTKGENWPIPKDKFSQTYDVQPGGTTAAKKKINVRAAQMKKPFEVKVSWSADTLKGKTGDFLVQYGPGDYGVVGKEIFEETYDTTAMKKVKPTSAKTKANPKTKTVSKQQLATEIEKIAKGKKVTKKAIMAALKPFAKLLGIASIGLVASVIVQKATEEDWQGVAEEILMASPAGIPIMVATGFFKALKNNLNKYGLEAAQDVARVKTNILDRL